MFSSNSSQVSSSVNYIENVFSTYLYTGTGATQTITNNIDTTTYGGLTWIKGRSGVTGHRLTDTARGVTKSLASETTVAQATESTGLTAFGTTGFTIGADADYNTSAATYVSWTFRKQAKFFDIVTYTGTGSARTVAHNLGAIPGMIIVKDTGRNTNWRIYNRGLNAGVNPEQYGIAFNTTDQVASTGFWNDTAPTSTVFTVNTDSGVNTSGENYVAYLFAHNAGGFGLTGTDNVVSCGTYTGAGANLNINLGYEPQFVMIKSTTNVLNWVMLDTMRGLPASGNGKDLRPNLTDAEGNNTALSITSTGFIARTGIDGQINANGYSYIYIAIRRGPMAVPTDATTVFAPVSMPPGSTVNAGLIPDMCFVKNYDNGVGNSSPAYWGSRLQGNAAQLDASSTAVEGGFQWVWNGTSKTFNQSSVGTPAIGEVFVRAPSFFDEVCYTGTGSATTVTHNLGAVPELMIVKRRDTTADWDSYCSALANTEYVVLNTTAAKATGATRWNSTTPTSSVFSVGTSTTTNASAGTYVAYLFATCAGVSKVGSYTGTGTLTTINCGFIGGARFVMIKRTDSTGNWWYWDTTRGMVAGNDQRVTMNNDLIQTAGNAVYTATTGFQLLASPAVDINTSGGTYIFLAIA